MMYFYVQLLLIQFQLAPFIKMCLDFRQNKLIIRLYSRLGLSSVCVVSTHDVLTVFVENDKITENY